MWVRATQSIKKGKVMRGRLMLLVVTAIAVAAEAAVTVPLPNPIRGYLPLH